MKISDLFRFSTDNLRRRLGRTILTIIGVVVGVCAIVVMVSLGIAVNRATDEMLQNWGDLTKITVYSYGAQQGTADLDDKMVEQFRSIDHVIAATPIYSAEFYGQLTAGRNGRYTGWGNIVGMDPNAIEPMGYTLITGKNLTDGQYLGKDKIPVLVDRQAVFNFEDTKKNPMSSDYMIYPEYDEDDWTAIKNLPKYDESGVLLNPEDSFFDFMNTTIIYRMEAGYDEESGETKYKEYELVVVGMIESGADDWMIKGGFIASLDDIKKMETDYKRATRSSGSGYGGSRVVYSMNDSEGGTVQVGGFDQVYVKVDDSSNMPAVEKTIKDLGYQYYSMSQEREQMQGQVAQTQLMLGGLAAVSLFVAALNIANTMTMAIYERTKEIGVMKVLGCKLSNIRQMFLIESGAIGLLGGVIGVVISILLSLILNYLPGFLVFIGVEADINFAGLFGLDYLGTLPNAKLSIIPLWLIIMALVFATVVGLLSGIAPANRAMKISSLEAIRHE